MVELIRSMLLSQFEAALAMMNDCLEKCPEEHWDGMIANFTFWQVAYHSLFFVDYYLSPGKDAFQVRVNLHPTQWSEVDDEFPGRRIEKSELLQYMAICLGKLRESLGVESAEDLTRPCGFPRKSFSRAELHLYNMRHVMHHTGQLSAFLRRLEVDPNWVSTGWKSFNGDRD